MKGSSGKDILIGGDGTGPGLRSDERSILDGAEGDDILLAGLSASDVRGGEGNDILIGGDGNAFVDGQGGKDVIALRGEISGAPVQSTVDFTQKIDGCYLIEAGNSNISFKNVEVFIGGEKLTTFKGSHSQRATFIAGEGGGEFHLQRGNTAFGRDDVVDKFYLYTKPPEDVVEEQLRLEYLKFNRVAIGNIGPEDIIYVNGVLFDGARVTSEMAPVLSYDDNGDFGPITSVWLTGESSYGLDFPRAAYLHKPDGWSSYSFQETETYRTVSFARIAATGAEGDRIRFESRQSMGDVSTLASNAEAGVISFRAGSATSWLDPFDGSRSDLSRDPLAADDERLDVVIDGFEEGDAGMTFTSDTLSNGSRYTFSADLDTGEDGPFSGSPGIWGTIRPWFDEHQGWYVGIDEEQDVIDGVTDGKAFGGGPSIDSSDPNFNWGDDPLEGEVQDYPGFVMASQTKTSNPDGESLAGGLGDDVLRGNIGSDVLVGEGGDDELRGDAGNDELYGGPGDDKLFGEGGDDLLDGGPGFDELDGGEGQDTLRGQDDDDRLTGGAGDDRLEGGTGNDVYVYTAEGGSDTIADGGLSPEEVDVLRFTNVVSDKVIVRRTVEGGNDLTITFTDQAGTVRLIGQLQGSAGVERFDFSEGVTLTAADIAILADQDDAAPKTLTGTPGPDTLVGADGNDSLSGLDGNDLLAGGRGDDTLIGGAGNDIFTYDRIDSGFDVIDGGTGTDTLRADAADVAIGITSLTSLEAITANGFANVSILGSAGNNIFGFASVTLTGIAKIDMGAGNDNVIGSGAADTVHGGAGADTLAGGNGNDALHGDSGSDSLSGGAGDDVLDGGDGDDAFSFSGTSGGFDAVVGGIGADTVRALANGTTIGLSSLSSVEAITAGTFTGVSVLGSSAGNLLDLSAVALTGITKVDGGSGNDTITGTGVADTLLGGSGDDVIASGAGDDAVQFTGTSSGFDDVDGGAGVDTLSALANSTVIGLRSITDVEAITAGAFTNVSVAGSSLSDVLDFSGVTLTGIARIDANGGNDQITGSAAADTIMGGSGDDTLAGGDGDDTFQFTSTSGGFDAISGGAGQNTVAALANSTVIGLSSLTGVEAITAGTFTGVTISGSGNADLLDFSTVTLSGMVRAIGGTGNDTLIGNATANTLWGGFGNDIVQGGAGDDSLAGDDGNDLLVGGEGSDTLTGGAGTDTADYAGSTAALTINLGLTTAQTIAAGEVETLSTIENLVTGSGNDTLTGSTAANNLKGGAGDDRITGGAGNDSLDGGLGADVAVFAGAKSTYQIVTTAGTTTVKDNATTTDGNDGTDTLIGIETAQFKDGTQALAAPIIFDLDGDGVTGVDQGRSKAKFDWNGDGNRDKTGWLDKGDGLLVFDRNGDGKMSGADELSFVNDKPGARSDLDGLTAFDSNGDGLFSGVDEQWASFRVWVDRDTDGKVDKRELKTLADLSIASITLAGQATERTWDWGEVVTVNTGTFTRTDGTAGGFSDVVLSYAASGKRAIVTQSAGFSDVGASTDPLGATAQLGMMRYEVHLTGEIPLI